VIRNGCSHENFRPGGIVLRGDRAKPCGKSALVGSPGAGRCSLPPRYRSAMAEPPLALIEFPADDAERARRFWTGLLGVTLESRAPEEGAGWQTHSADPAIGVHARGQGPGDFFALPYFEVEDIAAALTQVERRG